MTLFYFALWHYGMLGVFAAICYLVGSGLTCRLAYRSTVEQIAVSATVGLGAVASLITVLGLCRALHATAILCVLLLAAAMGCVVGRQQMIYVFRAMHTKIRNLGYVWSAGILLGGILVVALLTPYWMLPLYPPTDWDATSYHLAAAKIYTQHHQLVLTPYLRFATMPQAGEMLFVAALSLADDVMANLSQFLTMLLGATVLFVWGRRCGSMRIGWLAATLWLGNPMVLWLGSTAYIDIGLCLFATGATYAFWVWWCDRKSTGWLCLAGVLSGLAAGTKYLGLFFVVILPIVAVCGSKRHNRWRNGALVLLSAALVAAPWYIRNAWHTGDPLFPMLGRWVGYSFWSATDLRDQADQMIQHGIGRSLGSLLSIWWNLAFHQDPFETGIPLSFVIFLGLPLTCAVILWRHRQLRMVLGLAVGYLCIWFYTAQISRYLLPIVPLFALLTAVVLEDGLRVLFNRQKSFMVGASLLLGVALLVPSWRCAYRESDARGPLPATKEQRQAYLARRFPSYQIYQRLNNAKGERYTLYAFLDENMAYFADGVFMGDHFGHARYTSIPFETSEALYSRLKELGADHLLVTTYHISVVLPQDEFFQQHFRLVDALPEVLLFQLLQDELVTEEVST